MEQGQILKNIEELLPILYKYRKDKVATISVEQKLLLKDTYLAMCPYANVTLTCTPCIVRILDIMLSYYERENPKYLESLSVNQVETSVGEEMKVPPKKKSRQKKA
ncbi:MAG: hypothetical protein J0I41_23545 [Filimonas sp.]|nr:hypothetical protein [Filimonas sp.]